MNFSIYLISYFKGIGNQYYTDSSSDRHIFLDSYIPYLYYKIVKITHRDWSWSYQNNKFNQIKINDNDNVNEEKNINFNKDKNRINIGFLSSFFFRHSVGRLLASIIIELSKDKAFNIFLFTDSG